MNRRLIYGLSLGIALLGAAVIDASGEEIGQPSVSPFLIGWTREQVRTRLGSPFCIRLLEGGEIQEWSPAIFETMGRQRQPVEEVYRPTRRGTPWELVIRYIADHRAAEASAADVFSTPGTLPGMIAAGYQLSASKPLSLRELLAAWPEVAASFKEHVLIARLPQGRSLVDSRLYMVPELSAETAVPARGPSSSTAPAVDGPQTVVVEMCTRRTFVETESVLKVLANGKALLERRGGLMIRIVQPVWSTSDLLSGRLLKVSVGLANPDAVRRQAARWNMTLVEDQLSLGGDPPVDPIEKGARR